MQEGATITSPYAPDLGDVRVWLEKMVASLKLVQLVAAVLALVTRMRDINTELVRQVAHLRRRRPRSEARLAVSSASSPFYLTPPVRPERR